MKTVFPKRLVAVVAACAVVLSMIGLWANQRAGHTQLGVTFSKTYAEELGLDWREVYLATLDDLKVRHIRLPLYWNDIESEQGNYQWDDYDWMVTNAQTRGVALTVVVGAKVPRWPECYVPDWARSNGSVLDEEALLSYIQRAVQRYSTSTAVSAWQVENEAHFPFGENCPTPDPVRLKREIDLVRSLDPRLIQLTVSGELEPWLPLAVRADQIGYSLYRTTYNPYIGYFRYPLPPAWYALRSLLVRPWVARTVVSELQAEPWFPEAIAQRSLRDWYDVFTEEDLRDNVMFARQIGADEVYLWGVEWWYNLAVHGDTRLWDEGRALFGE